MKDDAGELMTTCATVEVGEDAAAAGFVVDVGQQVERLDDPAGNPRSVEFSPPQYRCNTNNHVVLIAVLPNYPTISSIMRMYVPRILK